MTDTPETDLAVRGSNGQWSFGLRDLCERLERERDAYAKTLRDITSMADHWQGETDAARIIRERHPEMGNAKAETPL